LSDPAPKVDLNLLRIFDVVMAERSVTRAAARLLLSQSAISGALARLRSAVNDQLFIRGRNGLVPTSAALALAEPISNALREIDRALDNCGTFDPTQAVDRISIHGDDDLLPRIVSTILPAVIEKAPYLSLRISPTGNESLEQLRTGDADLLITGFSKELPEYLRMLRLYRQRLVGLARRGRFKPVYKVTIDDFLSAEHVSYQLPEGMGIAGVDRELSNLGLSRNIKMTVGSPMMVPLVVQSTKLIGVLPEPAAIVAAKNFSLSVFSLPIDVPEAYVTLVWHERVHYNAGHRWLRKQVSELRKRL